MMTRASILPLAGLAIMAPCATRVLRPRAVLRRTASTGRNPRTTLKASPGPSRLSVAAPRSGAPHDPRGPYLVSITQLLRILP